MQQAARGMDDLGRLPDRLHRAGLVIGSITDTSAGGPPASIARSRSRSSTPERVTPMVPMASAGNRPPASTEACSMAETTSRSTGRPGTAPKPRRQRQRIGLGSA